MRCAGGKGATQFLSSRGAKHQAPNPKLQRSSKSQAPTPKDRCPGKRRAGRFWSLELGIWSFVPGSGCVLVRFRAFGPRRRNRAADGAQSVAEHVSAEHVALFGG